MSLHHFFFHFLYLALSHPFSSGTQLFPIHVFQALYRLPPSSACIQHFALVFPFQAARFCRFSHLLLLAARLSPLKGFRAHSHLASPTPSASGTTTHSHLQACMTHPHPPSTHGRSRETRSSGQPPSPPGCFTDSPRDLPLSAPAPFSRPGRCRGDGP